MYQHPAALDVNATYYRDEALHEAEMRRLVRGAGTEPEHGLQTRSFQRRLVAVAVALVTTLAAVALI